MRALLALITALAAAAPSWADRPVNGAFGMQDPATPIMREITGFHDLLLVIITVIAAFILALLVIVVLRYNARANPEPSKFSHNTLIEVIWTAVPIIILVVIAIPSFKLLYNEDTIPDGERVYSREAGVVPAPELTIKATGWQWHWSYAYPDNGDFEYISDLLPEEDAAPEDYLLESTSPLVAPAGATVQLIVTGADVIHNWAMPSFGIKVDAIPGRLNETWFNVEEPGTYYGQCSELCGIDHAFMPIHVEIVPRATFDAWAAAMQSGENARASQLLAEYKTQRDAETRLAELHMFHSEQA